MGWIIGSICLIWNRRVATYYRDHFMLAAVLDPPLLVTYRIIVGMVGLVAVALGTAACVAYSS